MFGTAVALSESQLNAVKIRTFTVWGESGMNNLNTNTKRASETLYRRTDNDKVVEQRDLIGRLMRENDFLRNELERLSIFRSMAYRDPLTGLHNRRYSDERIEEECARAKRDGSYQFGVILVDLNNFKDINDTCGHAAGDKVLRVVARTLKESVREVDICCRVGGDEFGILLPDTNVAGCKQAVQRIMTAVSQATGSTGVGLSIGVAIGSHDTADPATLMDQADAEMYRHKRDSKARARVHRRHHSTMTTSLPKGEPMMAQR
jgi:diguanylate cyclase (GGDEF)-like protein